MTRAHELAATAARVVPGLACRVSHAVEGRLPWHQCTSEELSALLCRLQADHPEAGLPYAAMRGWDLVTWQPVYLAVIAAHLHGARLDTDSIRVRMRSGDVQGCVLAEHEMAADEECTCLQSAGGQLRAGIDLLLPRWRQLAPLHPKAALWALADCAMAALQAVSVHRRDWSLDDLQEQGGRWLATLGLAGDGGFFCSVTPQGHALLRVRRVCCLHFRRRDGERCDGCPRLTTHERTDRPQRCA